MEMFKPIFKSSIMISLWAEGSPYNMANDQVLGEK